MKHDVAKQQAAGLVAWNFFETLTGRIKPGLNLLEIEELASRAVAKAGMKPAFLGYKDYPAVTCLSVNSAIVHGIPHDYVLAEGDVLAVDIGIDNDGFLVDTARSYGVGSISDQNTRLLVATKAALEAAILHCRAGRRAGDIGAVIQQTVEAAGFAVVKELTGHGVGATLQEEPSMPNHGPPGRGAELRAGMVVAIEPITAAKPVRVAVLADGWTVTAQTDVVTAHFEHTVLVTDGEPIVLTRPVAER